MPLPPLAANNTARYFVRYTANARNHIVQFRYDDGGVSAPPSLQMMIDLVVFFNAMRTFMPTDYAMVEAWYIASGDIVSVPAGVPLLVLAGTQPIQISEAPGYFTFVGRSTDGRKVRLFLLGAGMTPAADQSYLSNYRITASEDANIAAAIAALDASEVVAIGGLEPLWKGYVNCGYNAYWQKEMRG